MKKKLIFCTQKVQLKKKDTGEDAECDSAIINMKYKHTHSTIQFHFCSEHHIYDHNTQKDKHTVDCLKHIPADKAYLLEK